MQYYLYVIELDKQVGKIKKFRKQSPDFIFGNRCFYVGQSAKAPMLRFKQHKEGYKSNTFARRFGLKLVPKFYKKWTFDGEHYWEIGTSNYSLSYVKNKIVNSFNIINTFSPINNLYHKFFILESKNLG